MGVEMSEEEIWEFARQGHTGMLTTLRSDGYPVTLPVWFVTGEQCILIQTPSRARKISHIQRDPRVSFTIEEGRSWQELRAVVMTGLAKVVDDETERTEAMNRISEKYVGLGVPSDVPDATRRYYETPKVVIRIDPSGPVISWDNRKLRRSL